jgi:DNA-binding SARP family transcriptional activator/tetratricopeptide (TPR) repeat protein
MTLTREPTSRTRPQFGILGSLSATLHGDTVNLGGRRQRAVVAVLLLARGHQVSTERLLDALWDGSPPPSGPASLQSYVSHLRRALEPDRAARSPSRVLTNGGAGYVMPVPEEDVDAWRFERLVDDAAGVADPDTRVRVLREALGLWRGPALAEYAGHDWADFEARRLEELRDAAREQLLAARLDAGESALVVPEAEALLAEEPLREERWRLLALALYRSHRQADALAALRRARTRLADELGVDPGPALRALEAEVLAQSPTLDAPARRAPAPQVPEQRAVPTPAPDLVDRDTELRVLRSCLDDVLSGSPRLAVIEGPAGIGKTSLLQQVRQDARAAGATVLTARGSQLEKEFGFGAVRQLFEPVLSHPTARAELLTGAAAGAGQVFDAGTGTAAEAPPESLFAVLHGLYWLAGNLAQRGPLLIAVDDVQWCDTGSLRYLGYLVRRLEGLPVLVVVSLRTGEHHADEELLHELSDEPDAVTVRPRPLTPGGTLAVVRSRLEGADEVFVSACFRTTSGNPLLLRQLLRALESEGVRPDASHADTVRAIGSRAVSSMVMMRFRRMPEANRVVARAIAVLGHGASLPLVASMTGLPEEVTAGAIAGLARTEVLNPDHPLGFVHPLVESAVYDDLPLGEREMQHERAAHVLAASGASAEQVAAHLLHTPPRGNQAVVEALREAAQRVLARGSTDSATAYLQRALAEPPEHDLLPELLTELGALEAVTHGASAMEHLARAYDLHEDPAARAAAAIMLARTAVFASDRGDATRIARSALDRLTPELVDERQALAALELISAYMHGLDDYRAGPVPEIEGTGPGARALAAALAWRELCRGEDRARAIELARFALEDRVLQGADPGLLWVVAGVVLEMSGEETGGFWESELQHAYRTGGLFAALAVHLWLGYVQWQHGDLPDALQSMAHCTEQNDLWGSNYAVGQSYADAYMICMLLDRGSVEEAEHALDLTRDGFRIGEGVRLFAEAEAKVHFTRGRYVEALAALESVQDVMSTVHNPVWRPWRSMRAQVLARLGRREEALALVEEELTLARRWGTDTLVGKTLRVLGELRGEDGLPMLQEAVALLRHGPRRLELAQALRALGTLLTGRDDAAARDALEEALDLAERCGAYSLRERVAGLLGELGVEVPAEPRIRQAFTASERRIVELAVAGVPYPDIAQSLFATTSTVTTIVEAVCSRLGATDLDGLGRALDRHRDA